MTLPTPEPAPDAVFYLWPEGEAAFDVFLLCQTQWRHGMAGITGLDYTAVNSVIAMFEKSRHTQRQRLIEINALEKGALKAFNENTTQP